ncbi:MAG TPA: 50S ribosomal protein L22, partial [Candidatus Pacearchaeota archaeon]|nr:50S ribosomal protein L22 [Candidatus Pacearchaeota archaeon]
TVKEAVSLLQFTVRRSAQPVLKLLNSAAANAKHNAKVNPENLVISKITVDQGPILKRSMPRSRGSAFPIQKKISHVYIELSEKKGEKIAKKKKNAK